jgi:outer membrane protein with beta-barrel domain
MLAFDIWNKLNLHRTKVILLFLLAVLPKFASAQINKEINLPTYDERWLHYGFRFGLHSAYYNLKYSDAFVQSPAFDSVHSILAKPKIGFSVGFVANFRINNYWKLRLLPGVNFSEYQVEYNYTNDPQFISQEPLKELVESTMVELQILLKYKSIRRKNTAVYFVVGLTPSLEANGRKDKNNELRLLTNNKNLTAELGFGVDIYNEWYKFSPEIRFSRGLVNMLKSDVNEFSAGIESLNTNMISIYLLFEGGK